MIERDQSRVANERLRHGAKRRFYRSPVKFSVGVTAPLWLPFIAVVAATHSDRARLALHLAIAFAVFMLPVLGYQARRRRGIQLGPDGIGGIGRPSIPWSEITRIEYREASLTRIPLTLHYVNLYLADGYEYGGRASLFLRLVRAGARVPARTPSLSLDFLHERPKDVIAVIRQRYEGPMDGPNVGLRAAAADAGGPDQHGPAASSASPTAAERSASWTDAFRAAVDRLRREGGTRAVLGPLEGPGGPWVAFRPGESERLVVEGDSIEARELAQSDAFEAARAAFRSWGLSEADPLKCFLEGVDQEPPADPSDLMGVIEELEHARRRRSSLDLTYQVAAGQIELKVEFTSRRWAELTLTAEKPVNGAQTRALREAQLAGDGTRWQGRVRATPEDVGTLVWRIWSYGDVRVRDDARAALG